MDGMGYDPSFQKHAFKRWRLLREIQPVAFCKTNYTNHCDVQKKKAMSCHRSPRSGRFRPPWGDSPRLQHHLKWDRATTHTWRFWWGQWLSLSTVPETNRLTAPAGITQIPKRKRNNRLPNHPFFLAAFAVSFREGKGFFTIGPSMQPPAIFVDKSCYFYKFWIKFALNMDLDLLVSWLQKKTNGG